MSDQLQTPKTARLPRSSAAERMRAHRQRRRDGLRCPLRGEPPRGDDLTDPSSIPKELEAIVPGLAVPVQPLLEGSFRPYAMFKDYWKYEWVLPVYRYEGLEALLAALAEKVIAPAEGKMKALAERRRKIEAELTKPQ
jgi:hypothetical protein